MFIQMPHLTPIEELKKKKNRRSHQCPKHYQHASKEFHKQKLEMVQ